MGVDAFAYVLELDTAKDGTWATDESTKLIQATIRRGRADALSRMPPAEMSLLLNNADGRFSPLNADIANLDHDIPVRLYSTWTQAAVTNLDENPATETNTDGNVAGGSASIARDTAERWTGSAALKVTVTNADEDGVKKEKIDTTGWIISPNTSHTYRVQIKGAAGKNLNLVIGWFTAGDTFISLVEKAITISDDWQGFFFTATSPGTAGRARVIISTNGAQGAFDFFVDASFFYASATLLPYVDGRQPGCTWAGTADASTSSRSANPTFLLFQGFIHDFVLSQEGTSHRATIICRDRLVNIQRERISIGIMVRHKSGLVVHRLLDRVEGELITNYGIEDSSAISTGDGTNWSAIGAGTVISPLKRGPFLDNFEMDWNLNVRVDAATDRGCRYDATADLTDAGDYEAAIYARLEAGESGTRTVKFRYLRDSTEVAAVTATLTTTWQRIALQFTRGAAGTNRFFEVLTTDTTGKDFEVDDLHLVKALDAFVGRSVDAGRSTVEMAAAFDEPAGRLLHDILASERGGGQFFIEAKSLANGDRAIFHDGNHRSTVNPRLVLGDGDGLMAFASKAGLQIMFDAADRIDSVTVTSRGALVLGDKEVSVWALSPERNLVSGDEFLARDSQACLSTAVIEKVGGVKTLNANFGLGHFMEVDAAGTPAFVAVVGRPLDFPFASESAIEKRDATLQFNRNLPIAMPLQTTQSSDMDAEADALLTRYKGKIVRCSVRMGMQEPPAPDDELLIAFQMDLDLDEVVSIEAKHEAHSPNVNKKLWVEGIETRIEKGGPIFTVLHLEEV